MKIVSRKMYFTKLSVLTVFCALVFGIWIFSARVENVRASASGPTPGHTSATGEANCTACHTDFPVNSGEGSVTITGVPANYLPGQQYQITVRTSQASATIYGFQATAIDTRGARAGTFVLPQQNPARMQLDEGFVGNNFRQYIEHTVDGIIPAQFGFNTWTFTWTAPARRVGKVNFFAAGNAANSDGGTSGDYIYTTNRAALAGSANANFDADGRSDFSVFRPSTGVWYALNSSNGGSQAQQFGLSTDKIVPGDYDADGKTDLAVWRPSTGVWYIQRSSDGAYDIRQWGLSTDKIAQGDYDGDAKTDIAVFRPSTGDWYVWKSTDNGFIIFHFGVAEDKPAQADYDGDGKYDFAVFRPSTGVWYVQRTTAGFGSLQFGQSGDRPVPTDYDGDGQADFAVYRSGAWYVFRSSDLGVSIGNFGLAGDVPVPAGYLAE